MDDSGKRKTPRWRTLRTGQIVLGSGGVLDCVIRDASPSGARIRIAAPTPLPSQFKLKFASKGQVVRAELRWQKGVEAGVSFLDELSLDDEPPHKP